jgi:5-keto 4-deoxyuronate isomerase family protein/pfkB family carbohydrate kinase
LIVGTEEEVRIAGGSSDTGEALRKIRSLSGATIVLKTGAMGATVFGGEISDDLESGLRIPGYPVDVFNSTGAGDAFMSGFLRRWLDDEPLESCGELANACGAWSSPAEQGFGFQRVYTEDGSLDETVSFGDGDTVLVPKGHHVVSAMPGYDLYYLNVMAGPVRDWKVKWDPVYEWVRG